MKRILPDSKNIHFFLILLIILLAGVGNVDGANRFSVATGNWNSTATWSANSNGTAGASVPVAGDVVTIERGYTVTITADAACSSINANTNNFGILTFGGNYTLTVTGSVQLGGNNTARDLTINFANGSKLDAGSIILGTAGQGAGILDMTNGGTIRTGNLTVNTATGNSFTPGIGTVELDATNTLPATIFTSFNNLTINGGTTTAGVGLTVAGDLTITSGTFAASTFTHNIAGNFTNNGSFTQSSSSLVFNGTTQVIGGSTSSTFNNLTIGSSTSTTLGINTSVAGNLNITSGGFFDLSTFTCNRTTAGGTLTVAGTLLLGNNTGGQTGSNFPTNFSTMTMTGGTVNYYRTGTQTIYTVSGGYNNLTLAGSGAKTTTGVTVNGVLSMEGTATTTGTVATYGTGATLQYKGSSAQTTGIEFPATFSGTGGVIIDNLNGVTLNASKIIANKLTLTNGVLTTTGAYTVTVTSNSVSAVTGGSASNFINGPLIWTLAAGSTYTFPIGKGTTSSDYYPFGLTSITGTAPQIKVEAFTGNTSGTANNPLESLSTSEYWLASIASGTFTTGSVSLTRQSNLGVLNAIGRNTTTLNGTYSNLNGTVSGTSIITSDLTGGSLGYFVMAAERTITTSSISPTLYCVGESLSVPFTINGTYTSGNVFTAQLSDASGVFGSPVNIGSITQTTAGTISATIPGGTTSGTGYRIRVVSSTPVVTGSNNGTNLTVNSIPAQPSTITGSTTPSQGSSQTYSVTNVAGVTYTWIFPSGWTQTGGSTTNSVTVTVGSGSGSGNITVTPGNACGNGTARTLAVTVPSCITAQPVDRRVCPNGTTTFTVTTGGTRQWQVLNTDNSGGAIPTWTNLTNGGIYSGTTTSTLTLTNITATYNKYQYRCVVTGSCTGISSVATLYVGLIDNYILSADNGLINISPRPGPYSSILSLSGSQIGVNYQLRTGTTNVGAAVAGTGGPISFASVMPAASTNYNVLATGCTSIQLISTKTIVVNNDNLIIDLNPCAGQPGVNFFTNSEFGTITTNKITPSFQASFPGVSFGAALGAAYTPYTYGVDGNNEVNDNYYVVANSTEGMYRPPRQTEEAWMLVQDKNDPGNGNIYIVNASLTPGAFYTETLYDLCDSTKYEFSADIINVINPNNVPFGRQTLSYYPNDNQGNAYTILPNIDFLINGKVALNTSNLLNDGQWHTFGFTFRTGGLSNITLTIRNNSVGGIGNDLAIDNIVMRACGPLIQLNITTVPAIVCPGTPVTMTGVITASDYHSPVYQWQKSTDGGTNWINISGANSTTYTENYPVDGEKYRFITAETIPSLTNPHCFVASNVVTISTTADILTTTPATRCTTGTLTLGATANVGSTINWYANPTGGTSLGTGTSFTTPSLSSTTTYYVDATQSGCTSSPRKPVVATVYPSNVTASVSISANPGTNLCSGNTVVFTATPTNGGTSPLYQWKKNGTNISGATSTTYTTNTLANNDVITCVMTENPDNTCITGSPATPTSNSLTMTVASMPASVSIAASPGTTVCSGSSVTFTATPTNGGAIPTYQWKLNGSNISGATGSTYTTTSLTNGNQISCVMTSSFICATGNPATSNTVTMTVNPIPAMTSASTKAICTGSAVSLALTSNVTSSYSWIATDNTNVTGESTTSQSTNTINDNLVNSTATAQNVVYTVTPTSTTGSCIGTAQTVTVTVNPTNTAGTASSTPTLCINTALTNITHTTTGATGISNSGVSGANGLPAGVSAAWASNTITISGTPTASGTFSYSIPLTGGCGTVNATGTITVTANMTATAASSTPTLCINTPLTAITHTTTLATGISNDNVTGANGLPAGVSAHWASNTITITGTPTASGTFSYSIPLTGGCGTVNATGTITVTANMTAAAASSTPTLCINTPLTAITHTTTLATGISNDNVTGANGLPAGVSAHWASNTITITGTPTASGTFSYSIPLTGGCGTVNATGMITITANMTASAASSTPTLCINTALTPITHTTVRATGIGTATGLPVGVTATWASNTITISGTPTASGTFSYSIPLTGGCGTVNATGTITVTANMTATAASSTPTLCINTPLTAITHTTTLATGISNDNVTGANGLPAGVSAHWASNTITISGTPTASGTFSYSIPLTGGCGTVNATGTITVTANMTAAAASSTPTLCINTPLTAITHTTTLATGISNDNVTGANGLPAGVSAHWASNTITISGTPTASGTFSYSIPLTGGCGTVNATGTITVTPNMTAGAASSTPTLCINTALTAITHSTTGATGIGSGTGLPTGVTAAFASNTITISGTPTASGTFNYSIPLTGGCGTVNATGTITVTANMTATAASSTPTLCINTALTAITHTTTLATGISNDNVTGANGLPAGVSAHWASNTITITGTPTASGTFSYSIPLTGGCGTVNATGTITITANMTATAASSTPTLCINTPLTAITHTTTLATGISNDNVTGANGLPAGVSAHWASNTITISGTPTASGTFSYSIPLTGGCGTVNATGTITVTPNMTAGAASSTPTLCINTALTPITHTTVRATGIGTATGLPVGVTATWASNTITISGTPTASGTFSYSIPLTGGCGTVNATGTITVTANMTAAAASSTPTLCISTALTPITHITTLATGIGTATGLPAGVTATWASNTITISGTPTASGTFSYSIPLTGGCGTVNATGTITVTANMTATAASSTPTLCINTPLTAITHTTTLATGISNDNVTGANGLPAGVSAHWASNTITISGTPTASGTFSYSIPLTGGCGTVNATGTITVTPNMTAGAASSTPTLCINTALTAITHSTTGATGIGSGTGLPTGVTAAFASNTITISGTPTASGTFNYSIPLTGGCSIVNATGTITVNPQPIAPTLLAKAPNLASFCLGAGVSATFNSGSGGTGCTDDYIVIVDGGSPVAYTPGTTVGTTATTSIDIQGRRANCTGGSGCTGTSYVSLASWIKDNVAPTITCPLSITRDAEVDLCSAAVELPAPTALADNCGGTPTLTWTSSSGVVRIDATHARVAVGTSTITYRATDAAGNYSECSFTVTVVDHVVPTITCPAPVTVSGFGNIPAKLDKDTFGPGASDNCSISAIDAVDTYSNVCTPGTDLTITRTYTVTDSHGNSATCNQTITVQNVSIVINSASLTACSSKPVTFTSTTNGFSTTNYQWETSTDGGTIYSPLSNGAGVTGATSATLVISSPVIGHKYRLKVSTGTANQECYSNVLTLVADTSIPQFPVTPPKYSGGIVLCDQTGAVAIPDLISNIDAVDNCTELADLRTTYTIKKLDNTVLASGTNANVSAINTFAFPIGTSVVTMDIADQSGLRSGTITFQVKIGAVISLSDIAPDALGTTPNQGSTHTYSVTGEVGYTFTWTVNKETSAGSGVFTNNITSSLTITGQGSATAGITWGVASMPGNYRITVTKKNDDTHCEVSKTLDVTVANVFNPKVPDQGNGCHEIDQPTTIVWHVETVHGSVVAPSWSFHWDIYLVTGSTETLLQSDDETVTTASSDTRDINYTIPVDDGSVKTFRFRISNVQDSLGNPETNTGDDTDDVIIHAKPTIGF